MNKSSAATFLALTVGGSALVALPAKAQDLSDGYFEAPFFDELETSTAIVFPNSKIRVSDLFYKDDRPELSIVAEIVSGTIDDTHIANLCILHGDTLNGVIAHLNSEYEISIIGLADKDHLLKLRNSLQKDHKTHKISDETKFWTMQILHESNYCKPKTSDLLSQYLELPSADNARIYKIGQG